MQVAAEARGEGIRGVSAAKRYQVAATVLYLTMFAVALAGSLRATEGRLIYALDDPYIHLAVAENILRGGYGINMGEFSSPSSSILYPLLLALALGVGLGDWGPLLLGVAASALTVWIVAGFVWRYAVDEQSRRSRWSGYLIAPLIILSINAVALPTTGMEHSLHVLSTLLVFAGLAELRRGEPPPVSLLVGIVLAPLLRFEGLPLAVAGIAALAWQQHKISASVTGAVLAALLAVYACAMSAMGLPLLPSSVLVKQHFVAAATHGGSLAEMRGAVLANLSWAMSTDWGRAFIAAIPLVVLGIASSKASRERVVVSAATVAVLGAHIAFGKYGWFARYEVYAVAAMLLGLIFVYSEFLKDMSRHASLKQGALIVTLGLAAAEYGGATKQVDDASRNIYEQQFQMHRFAVDYFPVPVAVNDLGWVSYRNDGYVLDLWGLGSEEARKALATGHTPASLRRLTEKRDVKYAMLYDAWFPAGVPETWCRVATLTTSRVVAAEAEVAFYVIDSSLGGDMELALRSFQTSLPEGAALAIQSCEGE